MAQRLTDAEERALYGDPSRRSPIEIEVALDPGLILSVRFSGEEQAELHRAIGRGENPIRFIRETTMARVRELLAEAEAEADDAGSLTAAD